MKLTKETNKPLDSYQEKKDRSLLFLTFAVLSFFSGLILTVILYNYTLIDIYTLSKFFIGFTIIGFIIPLKYYTKWFHFIKYEMVIFNVIGVGPLFMGLFLAINFIFSSNPNTQTYRIEKLYFDNGQFMGVILENDAFSDEQKITSFTNALPDEVVGKSILKLTIATGVLGYDVIKERELLNK